MDPATLEREISPPVTTKFTASISIDAVAVDTISSPLMLVAVATPRTGVTSVGLVAKTSDPPPVSSEITPASSDDEVAANTERLFDVAASVPEVGKVTAVFAVSVNAAV